jgi:hypothetical protein
MQYSKDIVVWGIDGLEDTHAVYRVNTDWNKIISNAKIFIQAGGRARWNMLAFKHNEHQIESCQELSKSLGFEVFEVKHTSRFKDNKFHVLDEIGKTVNILYPSERSTVITSKVLSIETAEIQCKARKYKQLYIC